MNHAPSTTMTSSAAITSLASELGTLLSERHWTITTAESCTGGGISAAITDIAGSSGWFREAFVTYSNDAKTDCLGVPEALIARFGAVSEEVVMAMLDGVLAKTHANAGIAVSGIAGPSGGSEEKPVGTVWLAWGGRQDKYRECFQFDGVRSEVRARSVLKALECTCTWLRSVSPDEVL